MNKQNNVANEQVIEEKELTTLHSSSKIPFVEPTVSTPEDVLEATTFFQAPTVDTTTV